MNNTDLKIIANRLDEIHAMIYEINSNLDWHFNNRSKSNEKSNDVEQKLSDIIKSKAPIESKKVDVVDVLQDLDKQISSTMYKNTIAA